MECPECGALNLEGAERCNECGVGLVENRRRTTSMRLSGYLAPGLALLMLVGLVVSSSISTGGSGGSGSIESTLTTSAGQARSAASSSGVEYEVVRDAVASDMGAFQSGDYSSVYAQLPAGEKSTVAEAEWLERAAEVESALGRATSYEIKDVAYLDDQRTIVIATLDVEFAKCISPRSCALYYVWNGVSLTPTMLWGREMTVTVEPIG